MVQTMGVQDVRSKDCGYGFFSENYVQVCLKIGNHKVQFKPHTRFLGLKFDKRLTWKQHMNFIVDRCRNRLNLLKCISHHQWVDDSKMLLMIYKAMIRLILDYGCEAFDSASHTFK